MQIKSVNTEWMWNGSYQILFDKVKTLIKEDDCMNVYDETRPLYLHASGVGMGAWILQIRDKMNCH